LGIIATYLVSPSDLRRVLFVQDETVDPWAAAAAGGSFSAGAPMREVGQLGTDPTVGVGGYQASINDWAGTDSPTLLLAHREGPAVVTLRLLGWSAGDLGAPVQQIKRYPLPDSAADVVLAPVAGFRNGPAGPVVELGFQRGGVYQVAPLSGLAGIADLPASVSVPVQFGDAGEQLSLGTGPAPVLAPFSSVLAADLSVATRSEHQIAIRLPDDSTGVAGTATVRWDPIGGTGPAGTVLACPSGKQPGDPAGDLRGDTRAPLLVMFYNGYWWFKDNLADELTPRSADLAAGDPGVVPLCGVDGAGVPWIGWVEQDPTTASNLFTYLPLQASTDPTTGVATYALAGTVNYASFGNWNFDTALQWHSLGGPDLRMVVRGATFGANFPGDSTGHLWLAATSLTATRASTGLTDTENTDIPHTALSGVDASGRPIAITVSTTGEAYEMPIPPIVTQDPAITTPPTITPTNQYKFSPEYTINGIANDTTHTTWLSYGG
jgi:hypothetical protein